MRDVKDIIKDAIYLTKTHEKTFCYWHYEATYRDFPVVMDKLGKMLTAMSNVNLHTEIVINNNPSWCASGSIIDICLIGTKTEEAFFDSHKDVFGL